MALEDFGGAVLKWPEDSAEDRGLPAWHVAAKDTEWFSPSKSSFMINYRVDNLGELLEQLRAAGVAIIQGPESHENGKFAWIMDPDDNKVELWEPKLWADKNKGAWDWTPHEKSFSLGHARSALAPSHGRYGVPRRAAIPSPATARSQPSGSPSGTAHRVPAPVERPGSGLYGPSADDI